MNILGLNAFHGDSSAVLLVDGAFHAGIEEERLNRIKHWAGFPAEAIRTVLAMGGIGLHDIGHVAISRDPKAHLFEKALFAFKHRPGLEAIRSRLQNHRQVGGVEERLAANLGGGQPFRGQVHNVEHHRAHLASAFYCSRFEDAACLTVDGFGDFLSSMSAVGRGTSLEILDDVMFPHSLGIFYTAVTQFLGFPKYGDEYKVMGLASYGRPIFLPQMREIVHLRDDGRFETDLDYFRHASDGVTMSWEDGEPTLGPLWSRYFVEAFGPAREPAAPLTEREHDIAASLQAMYEEAFFHRLRWLQKRTGRRALCLAGGCAMNSVANGKIFTQTDFSDVFVQSAAGDAGTALGAAQYVWHNELGHARQFVMEHSYWGPEFSEAEVTAAIVAAIPAFQPWLSEATQSVGGLQIQRIADESVLARQTAAALASGEIVGWFQGRTEWGPRALGNRSILADPRRAEMKDVLNARIKRREPFRPFAPSILEERAADYFEESYPDPFMIKVYPVRASKRREIPAVTHVDGTGRLQTVSKAQNPRYWALITAFEKETGVPVVLNTSFNENEPIVNTPGEALACFLRTRMDRLVLHNWVITRPATQSGTAERGAEA
jgi:carbamoyltransferase